MRSALGCFVPEHEREANPMGIFDKAKDMLNQHPDKIEQGLDRAAGLADQRTGGKHADKIDKGVGVAKQKLGEFLGKDTPPPPA